MRQLSLFLCVNLQRQATQSMPQNQCCITRATAGTAHSAGADAMGSTTAGAGEMYHLEHVNGRGGGARVQQAGQMSSD